MVELIRGLSAAVVRSNLERVRSEIAACGRDPDAVEILAATKYLGDDELPVLAQAGIGVVGENRAQDLVRRAETHPDLFTWDFIGALQSRKVQLLLPYVRYIHSVASESALAQLKRHGDPTTKVLIQVNVAGEPGKSGIPVSELKPLLERCPVPAVGLMTMPPFTENPERSRPHFAHLRKLAERNGLQHLSMGTSQDYLIAIQEGATILRLGSTLYGPGAS